MYTFFMSILWTLITVIAMLVLVYGKISIYIMIFLFILLTLYFKIFRVKNTIETISRWTGKAAGSIITAHPGGYIEIDGKKIYREQYVEYQFLDKGRLYTSVCLDAINDPGGTLPLNLSSQSTSMLSSVASMLQNQSRPGLKYDLYDSNDPADIAIRNIHNSARAGDEITVYYNKENPAQSTLVRRQKVPKIFVNQAIKLIGLCILAAFVWGFRI